MSGRRLAPRVAAGLLLLAVLLLAVLPAAARGQEPRPIPPRNTGPAAVAHSRVHQHRRRTVRMIRRTPEVMREDAARVSRGELFRTWSNDYLR